MRVHKEELEEAEATEARRQAMLEAQPLKYEAMWLKIIEFLKYVRDEKRIEKARRVWRAKRYEKRLLNDFFFPWSKRRAKMLQFVEKEKKSWFKKYICSPGNRIHYHHGPSLLSLKSFMTYRWIRRLVSIDVWKT